MQAEFPFAVNMFSSKCSLDVAYFLVVACEREAYRAILGKIMKNCQSSSGSVLLYMAFVECAGFRGF